jgi:hypothetical protein
MRCELVPECPATPIVENANDLVWAFSLFTHLTEDAAYAVQHAIRASLKERGILAMTYRPASFWRLQYPAKADALEEAHAKNGFAFVKHQGQEYFGDASMTREWIEGRWPGWRIVGEATNPNDVHQPALFLQRK